MEDGPRDGDDGPRGEDGAPRGEDGGEIGAGLLGATAGAGGSHNSLAISRFLCELLEV
jgi:hypothetical protein